MYRFTKFLSSLEHYELVRIKKQLETGDLDIEKEVQGYIKDLEKKHATDCVTCSNTLDTYNTNNYTLVFGPDDFRKKASFCGLDCLEYFFIKLKQMKQGDKNTKKIE